MNIDQWVAITESWENAWTFKRIPFSLEEKEQIYAIYKGWGMSVK